MEDLNPGPCPEQRSLLACGPRGAAEAGQSGGRGGLQKVLEGPQGSHIPPDMVTPGQLDLDL